MTKTYQVSYYLGETYHKYLVVAVNEYEAIRSEMNRISEKSRKIMHDFWVREFLDKQEEKIR